MATNTTISSSTLKRRLGQRTECPEDIRIRLHRSISWLQCAEKNVGDDDLNFITLWIALNACYAMDGESGSFKTERGRFKTFIQTLVGADDEQRIFNLLWEKFSGAIRILLNNQYVYRGFWDYQRGDATSWKGVFEKSNEEAIKYLSANNVSGVLEILLDRLYILRNQLIHGGSTYKSGLNRKTVKDGCRILEMLIPVIVDIIMLNPEKDWGRLLFPVVRE